MLKYHSMDKTYTLRRFFTQKLVMFPEYSGKAYKDLWTYWMKHNISINFICSFLLFKCDYQ